MVYSGNVINPITSITEGINTYRIIPILLNNKNADRIIAESSFQIFQKQREVSGIMHGEMHKLQAILYAFIPIALKEKIRKENNIEVLSKLLRYAAKCKSIDEFIQKAL